MSETVGQSLHHSCRSLLMRQAISLPWDSYSYCLVDWSFHSKLYLVQYRADVRLYTLCFHLAESCVFKKQSLPSGMCRSPNA
nr:hypothetical protein Q903MT_gene4643 [Picea sitchensis]